jgi:hypothetical protein
VTLLAVALVTATVAALRGMWSPCGLSMLSSINPVSESARGNRFRFTALWYLGGALVGGGVLGTGLAVAASGVGRLHPSATVVWAVVLAAALMAAASDGAVFGRSLPDHPRQVDERWLVRYRRWIYAGGYGVQIGTGFATYIMTAGVHLTAVLAVLTGSPVQAAAIGVLFGGIRGLTIFVASGARTPERLRSAHRRLERLALPSLRGAIATEGAVAAVAGWLLGGPVAATAALALVAAAAVRAPVGQPG